MLFVYFCGFGSLLGVIDKGDRGTLRALLVFPCGMVLYSDRGAIRSKVVQVVTRS